MGIFGVSSFTSTLSGLSACTTYHFAPYSVNSAGTSYATDSQFTTPGCTASVVAEPVTVARSSGSSQARKIAVQAQQAVAVSSSNSSPVSTPTLSMFIEALIKAGIVPTNKIEAARAITATAPTTISSTSFKRDLRLNDTGSDVKTLQTLLISKGFLAQDKATGTFGPLTFAALKKYQESMGIISTGYFGPITRAGIK
jgi:hypothetical protein